LFVYDFPSFDSIHLEKGRTLFLIAEPINLSRERLFGLLLRSKPRSVRPRTEGYMDAYPVARCRVSYAKGACVKGPARLLWPAQNELTISMDP
jgi:hypothetical protein